MEIHELHATDDARVWAREFVQTVSANAGIPTDVATMEGWFANAMCAARDADTRRRRQRTFELTETAAQKVLHEKHGTPDEFEAAIWRAHAQCFITTDEALTGVAKYRNEWAVAGDADRQPPPTTDKAEEGQGEVAQDQT